MSNALADGTKNPLGVTKSALRSIDGANAATLAMYGLMIEQGQHCGQYVETQNGPIPTTIYNPPRSDPRVEAVKGEAVYNPRKETKQVDEMQEKLDKTQNELITLKEQLSAVMAQKLSSKETTEPVEERTATAEEIAQLKAELQKYKDKENKQRMAKVRAAKKNAKGSQGA